METNIKFERLENPRIKANIFEIITFSWMFKIFKKGQEKDLEVNDLFITLSDHMSSSLGDDLEKEWKLELTNSKNTNRNPSLLRILIKMFGTQIVYFGLILFISEVVLKVSQPLLIGGLLAYFNSEKSKQIDLAHAYMYALGLIISILVSVLLFHSTQAEMLHLGMKIRIAYCAIIFRKALRLSQMGLNETTTGQIVNLLSNDVNRIDLTMFYIHFLWLGPVQILVTAYFLWQQIGVSSILGVAALVILIPFQGWMGKIAADFRLKTAARTDERVRLINEIISGIQVIKMYIWEKPFTYLVENARKEEIKQIRGSSYISAIFVSFTAFHSRVALFMSIFSYVLLGNYITAQQVFIMTSYFNQLRLYVTTAMSRSIVSSAEAMISIKRIQNFLSYEEKNDQAINISKAEKSSIIELGNINNSNIDSTSNNIINNVHEELQLENVGIVVSNATAKWTIGQTDNSLENINLTVRPGRLVAIIGSVGAGKSSLIQAILRELPLIKGDISVRGVISYASQKPWLFTGSIQQNILFGLPMDEKRYKEVIDVCALKTDLQQFPCGDKTNVGERGVSLSGGQRARINLARAVYKQADIYILDDPLSAVDTHVGRHLFEKCIKDYLKEKICILITHQVQFLIDVDQIVLMENANVIMEGTYDEIKASNLDFATLLRSPKETTIVSNVKLKSNLVHQVSATTSVIDESKVGVDQAKAIEEVETNCSGNISYKVYFSYFFAGGRKCKLLFFIFTCIFTQVLASGGDFWIAYWVNLEEHVFHNMKNTTTSTPTTVMWLSISRETCINVFTVLTCCIILVTSIRSAMFVSVCMKASINLHNEMFKAISSATMFFFNTNSSGQILNRFSKDFGAIDEILPVALMDSIHYGLTLVGVLVIVGIMNIYLTIPTFFLVYFCYKLTVFFLQSSRSIKRLEGVTRSPVFSHLNATLQGLTTIRAYEAEEMLSNEFDNRQDLHSSVWYIYMFSNRAFGLWLDLIYIIYISIVTFSFIVLKSNDEFAGSIGLAITQVFALASIFQYLVRQSVDLENQMVSVERVLEYTNISQERVLESPIEKKPPKEWPSDGQIIFKNFYLKYGPNSHFVINNLNINIESQQKVGIVGRTGAGKSSLIGALFRLNFNEGHIIIDGIEIHELGLRELRSKLSIIPQEPVLFSGTVRKNLDPLGEYSDCVLWNALDEVKLKDVVNSLPNGLNSIISEGGSNFSVGQRQLVCLARAIVKNNKILILDEATANIDPQTDALIQNTIKNKFRACTVLTIAHRLNTIMDSDKVLVLDAGAVVEFDHPYNLLKNNESFLFKMVEQTGQATADLLHGLAAESYDTKKKAIHLTPSLIIEDAEDVSKRNV